MKDLITAMAQSLVDMPAGVSVMEVGSGSSILVYELRVAEGVAGKIIGKKGRTIVRAFASRVKKHVIPELID